jgi:hypothetical protein
LTRVNMPPGCYGLKIGSKEYNAKPGGTVDVPPEAAAQIARSSNGKLGIVSGRPKVAIATKGGRWCQACRFLAQSWSAACPRCGQQTAPE